MRIKSYVNAEEALRSAINYLAEILENNKDKPVLLLLSGGSAFSLVDNLDVGQNVTVGVLDERYSDDESINNFSQLMKTDFYKKAQLVGCKFIDTRFLGESQQVATDRFENILRDWKNQNSEGKVIITQGIGPDGHTAGIMPYPEDEEFFRNNFQSDNWVASYDTKNKNPYPLRITTTITFLIDVVDISIVYAVGEKKKKPLYDLQNKGSIAEVPARVLKKMKEVVIFTDQNLNF